MIRRPPRSTLSSSSAASDVYKRQIERGSGQGHTHLAGTAVAHVAHSVYGLPSAAGGDHHAHAAQVGLAYHLQTVPDLRHDTVGVGHTAGTVDPTGQFAGSRLHHERAVLPDDRYVALRRRVVP